jgi:hypothetical protein
MKKIFALIALAGLVVGFAVKDSMVSGIGKALAGVFFILWYIWLLFASEPVEKTGGH